MTVHTQELESTASIHLITSLATFDPSLMIPNPSLMEWHWPPTGTDCGPPGNVFFGLEYQNILHPAI
jgi:hypothetical protein